MTNNNNGFHNLRRRVLFFAGLIGMFVYLGATELLGRPFHIEWLLAFLAMMGVSLAQGADKK